MLADNLTVVLGWCFVVNYLVLLVWALLFIFAKNWLYGLHSRWFELSRPVFDAMHYELMGAYKLLILVLFLAPYLAIHLAGG